MKVDPGKVQAFQTPELFGDWLRDHHATECELWLKIYKKSSGIASLTWKDAVLQALAWGWIDGIKKSNDDASWFQRFTPRGPKSNWSMINRTHVETLIRDGKMFPAGMRTVEAARADGRWDNAYAGSATMTLPQDFLDAVASDPKAKATFDSLNSANRFAIYHRLRSAKKEETRQKRMKTILQMLRRGETIH